MLIDTHCHLDFEDFEKDRDDVLKRAIAGGVTSLINIGTTIKGSRASVELTKRYKEVYACIGIHPHYVGDLKEEDITTLRGLSSQYKVVGIGEMGLDYYKSSVSKKTQKEAFVSLASLAKELDLPLVIHSRVAYYDVLKVLNTVFKPPIRGVVHCFSGDIEIVRKCLEMGLDISFTGNLTFKKSDNLRDVARFVPLDRILLETDAPFLAPQAVRGRRNEPAFVRYTAQILADIKGVSFEDVGRATTSNARSLFEI